MTRVNIGCDVTESDTRWRTNFPGVSPAGNRSPSNPSPPPFTLRRRRVYLPKAPAGPRYIVVVVGNAETRGTSRYEKTHPSCARTARVVCACNSVTPVRDQTVGRRAAYLYTLRARRPVERRRSCRVVSRREKPKARFLSLSFPPPSSSSVHPRRQLHLPRATATRSLATWDVAAEGDGSRLSSLALPAQLLCDMMPAVR